MTRTGWSLTGELLRQFYQNRGYYDFRVTSAVAELTPDQKDWYITFTIDERQAVRLWRDQC